MAAASPSIASASAAESSAPDHLAASPSRRPSAPEAAVAPAAPAPTDSPTPAAPPAFGPPRPVRLLIPSLNLDAAVEGVGLDGSGAMGTPQNPWNVGWYNPGPAPGAGGDAVIDGHLGLPGYPLVFSGLGKLRLGDLITVLRSDGVRSEFAVRSMASWPANSHPPGLFDPSGAPRLSLITCTGSYSGGSQTYADRLVVEARWVGTGA